jgi:hypothetical protein
MAPPVIDGVLALAGTIATIIMIRDITRPRCGAIDINGGTECTWEIPTMIGAGLASVALGYSAYRGTGIYGECTRATVAYSQTPAAVKSPVPPSVPRYVAPIVILSILATAAVSIAVGAEISRGFHL